MKVIVVSPGGHRRVEINQCDGCRRGIPAKATFCGGYHHINKDGSIYMACTAHLYAQYPSGADAR